MANISTSQSDNSKFTVCDPRHKLPRWHQDTEDAGAGTQAEPVKQSH